MSLRDASNKMSKSDVSKYSRILLTDSNDDIATKISKAKSDSQNMPSDIEGVSNRPEINNLLNIYAAVSNQDKSEVIDQFQERKFHILNQN